MTNTSNSKRPTHRVYAVTERDGKKFNQPIGAAWEHSDRDGLWLKLEYLPLNGAEISVRRVKPNDTQDAGVAQ